MIDFLNNSLLSILIFLPLVGAIAVLMQKDKQAVRWTALATTLLTFILSLFLFATYDWSAGRGYSYAADGGVVQMVTRLKWIPAFNVEYLVGIDGLSFPLVILSTFVCVLACIASWNIEKSIKGYFALFLLLETGIMGVFLSLDFFLFYVFFEVSLLPMYFLIGIWGGPRKEYAAIKFFLYTLVGSVGLLIVMIGIYLYTKDPVTGLGTFDLVKLASPEIQARLGSIPGFLTKVGPIFFFLSMLGFLIKVPAVPLHTWLPDAHVEAPTPISMILAAILLKMGGYGIFRIAYPVFPDAAKEFWLIFAIIGAVSIIYGAFCAMAQTDFKKLVAYSSVSHMGLVVLGASVMTVMSVNGALFMMVAHGITSAAMFFVVGVIYERAHHRDLNRFGGMAATMPVYTGFSMVAMFANLGLPGLCGFIGEVMVLLGSFQAAKPDGILYKYFEHIGPAALSSYLTSVYVLAIIAATGVVWTAGYMLWSIQRVFFGPEKPEYKDFPEISPRELTVLVPLSIMAVALGVLPSVTFFIFTDTTVKAMFAQVFN